MYVDLKGQYEIDRPINLAFKGIVKGYSRIVYSDPSKFFVWAPRPVQPYVMEFDKCGDLPTTRVVYEYGGKDFEIVYHPVKEGASHIHIFSKDPRVELEPREAKAVADDFIARCLQKGVARKKT